MMAASSNVTSDDGYYGNQSDYTDYMYHNGTTNDSYTYDDSMSGHYEDYGQGHGNKMYEYTEFVYEEFPFERPIYLYVWEIFVTVTVLVNILVIWVLLQKKMRSVTNLILVGVAISDSMTGLVTLPTYIMVYTNVEGDLEGEMGTHPDYNNTEYYYDGYEYDFINITGEIEQKEAYILSKSLCRAFMISKFFLSKSFHTISIWLTLFLGVQRYISVAYPFRTQVWFTKRNVLIVCIVIAVAAPILHLYHLINEKATNDGFCSWKLEENCGGGCAHIWITLFLRHLIPCAVLTVTTILFVCHLNRNPFNESRSRSVRKHSAGNEVRGDENRRVSKIVIAIVVVFLIPEVPYGLFLLYSAIVRHAKMLHLNDLKRNRAIHVGYELALVLSFHLNFYIYTFVNKRFRHQLMKMCTCLTSRVGSLKLSSRLSSFSSRKTVGKTDSSSYSQDSKATEMKTLNHSESNSKQDSK